MMPDNELSRPITVDELPARGVDLSLNLSSDEMEAIVQRLGIDNILSLVGSLKVVPAIGREIIIEGNVVAEIEQACVVTGDPVVSKLEFPLFRRYSETTDEFGPKNDESIGDTMAVDDDPDPIVDGIIDAGEAVVEELSLQIPVYPRIEGASLENLHTGAVSDATDERPFAALAELKDRLKSNN